MFRKESFNNLRKFKRHKSVFEILNLMFHQFKLIHAEIRIVDDKIKKIEKDSKKVSGELKGLLKADKKQDKIVAKAKKKMKKGKC